MTLTRNSSGRIIQNGGTAILDNLWFCSMTLQARMILALRHYYVLQIDIRLWEKLKVAMLIYGPTRLDSHLTLAGNIGTRGRSMPMPGRRLNSLLSEELQPVKDLEVESE